MGRVIQVKTKDDDELANINANVKQFGFENVTEFIHALGRENFGSITEAISTAIIKRVLPELVLPLKRDRYYQICLRGATPYPYYAGFP